MSKVKQTSPGIVTIPLSMPKPSRPQVKPRMGVGGRKATFRHKGRVDPKAGKSNDPASTPVASGKVHWPTPDKRMHKGYVVGKGWPAGKENCGPNPYMTVNEGGYGATGVNQQDSEGSYSESGQAAAE